MQALLNKQFMIIASIVVLVLGFGLGCTGVASLACLKCGQNRLIRPQAKR